MSRTDVAFVTAGDRPRIVATTLPPTAARALGERLEEALAGGDGEPAGARRLELAGAPWLAQVSPLKDAAGQPVGATVALASLDRALAPFRQIEMALLGAGLAAVLLALALTWFFTRRALRPVERLAAAAEAAREGQYDQRIEAERGDEVGRLAQAFNELMAELREKRDMERYVTELSRNLPEPVQAARAAVGPSEERSVLLMAVELRRYAAAKADSDPRKPLELLSRDLRRLANSAAARRGRLETIAGHRALLSFEGPSRAFGALAVAGELLDGTAGGESTLVALAAGKVISGPVHWREQPEQGLVGLPVQQLESLLREASPGDIVLSREVYQRAARAVRGRRLRAGRAARPGLDPAALRPRRRRGGAGLGGAAGDRRGRCRSGAVRPWPRWRPVRSPPSPASRRDLSSASASRSSRSSAPAAWGSSTRRRTASSTTWWRSRCSSASCGGTRASSSG